ncbi:MAG: hypothetical protein II935_07270 [Bacteroidales bacterium]|nr:hypothetical protein [Bacteroidales bacterium]MBQ4475977.1 hypothetical protein [Bacteroidales bacterium]MBQ7484685.1 hypothetical protein [Bacteroidaceae bacterium]
MDAIISFIIERWPIMVVVIVVAIAVWLFARWYYKHFKRIEEHVKALENLPCGKHEDMFVSIKEDLTVIRTYLTTKYPTAAPVFSRKQSPRILNEAGKKLLEDIGGTAFLSSNREFLIKSIDEKKPKTALDVEESSLLVLYDHLDDDIFNDLKKWVYNSPSRKLLVDGTERDYTVTMNDVCFVLSIPLRDIYLELHPELQ